MPLCPVAHRATASAALGSEHRGSRRRIAMQPYPSVSLPSQSATSNAGPGWNTRYGPQESDVAGAGVDENALLLNELHLLATKIEQLSTANRRKDEFLAILSHE